MLKKLALSGTMIAAFAGMALATPAQAATPWPGGENNASQQNGNTITCGNTAIGDVAVTLLNLTPVTLADRKSIDCGVRVNQS
ncbi:hypothetical protein [Spongiactinospora sp. TRM90649]|uniref:hypothetical protein n=1 Tax=Spongiactinospora sp. TRM90649 TaxID=3031114 RepID=UPI0023F8F0D8|nr:hypothetical protein [Spongiactinospora sp. TRM90649]MDF5751464.1 hypothetical protein [Spongiactinospora sp. TRM90649]